MNWVDYCADTYHVRRHPEMLSSPELRQAWAHFADYVYFKRVSPGMHVLEFGGGFGQNLLTVKDRAQVWMVEPSRLARRIAQKSGLNVASALEDVPQASFDVILCRHVLEHLDEPLTTLRRLRHLLSTEGMLTLVVPCESWSAMPAPNDINHHLYCWNPQTLSNLVSRAALRVKTTRFEFFGARRKLLPVYRMYGGRAYARMVRFVGSLFRFRELVMECELSEPSDGRASGTERQ